MTITPTMIIKEWKTPQQIAKNWHIVEGKVREACTTDRLTDDEKVKLGEKVWLVSVVGANRLWKRKSEWKTIQEIEEGWNVSKDEIYMACKSNELTEDTEKIRQGKSGWLIAVTGADRLWKRI